MSEKIPTVKEMQAHRFAAERNAVYDRRPKNAQEKHEGRLAMNADLRAARDRCMAAAKEMIEASQEWTLTRGEYRAFAELYPDVTGSWESRMLCNWTNPFEAAAESLSSALNDRFTNPESRLPAPIEPQDTEELRPIRRERNLQ